RENRAKVIQFYNKVSRSYDQSSKKLASAKYFEDINRMTNLREPEDLDLSVLSPEDRALVQEKRTKLGERLGELRQTHRQRSRELRTKRMPMSKRKAKAAQARARGAQPRYFNPHVDRRTPPSQAFLQPVADDGGEFAETRPGGLPQTPHRGQLGTQRGRAMGRPAGARSGPAGRGGNGSIQQQVASALAQLGNGPVTPDVAASVAQSIASQVAQQVTEQVVAQLTAGGVGVADPELLKDSEDLAMEKRREANGKAALSRGQTQSGKTGRSTAQKSTVPTDGWGIQRNFSADLGGAQREVVKPAVHNHDEYMPEGPDAAQSAEAPYTGKLLVKDASQIREMPVLMSMVWKSMSRAEQALLKNLGWSQQNWDTKDTPAARWPTAMATAFMSLTPVQRESLKKLGFTAHEWDKRIQAFTMGKNA
ncbi:MAG: hypothetical protein AAFY60_10780, partial [Myxococcota bacterium]